LVLIKNRSVPRWSPVVVLFGTGFGTDQYHHKIETGPNSCAAGYVTINPSNRRDGHITTTAAAAHCAKTAKI